jgi:hypothetical protein
MTKSASLRRTATKARMRPDDKRGTARARNAPAKRARPARDVFARAPWPDGRFDIPRLKAGYAAKFR